MAQESPLITDQLTERSLDLLAESQRWVRTVDQPIGIRMKALDLAAGLEISIIARTLDSPTAEEVGRLQESIRQRAATYERWMTGGFGQEE